MNNLIMPFPKQIFVFGHNQDLGTKIAEHLKMEPSTYEIRKFPDGERIPHQTETVRGRDVYIVFTSQNGNDCDRWFIDYLRFCESVKAGEPWRITVVIPKLPHQRQDVENRKSRQPKLTSFFPSLFKAVGVDKLVVVRLHNNASTSNIIPMDNVGTTKIIIEEIKNRIKDLSSIVIATPDIGGSSYARSIAKKIDAPLVIVDKNRDPNTGDTETIDVYIKGDVTGKKTIIFVDDLISTFGTLKKGAQAVKDRFPNFTNFIAVATHADFGNETGQNIDDSLFSEVWVTDSVPLHTNFFYLVLGEKIKIISISKIIAQTIDNLHNGESVSDLWLD